MIKESLRKLIEYVECQQYKGYDPYDTLNSWFPFHWFGKWGPPIVTQIQKRNPINLRPIMGIKKGVNPKAMGVFLKAYSLLYKKNGDRTYREKADYFFNWLKQNSSKGYSGHCWGSNFHWANPGRYLQAYIPSVVVTSFVVDGIYSYYKATGNIEAVELIKSAAKYIVNDIPISRMPKGLYFAYTHLQKDCCYNASLLAAEVLAKSDEVNKKLQHTELIKPAVDYILSKQKIDGEWWYSYNPEKNNERKQIDFHQGFVLVSLNNIKNLTLYDIPGLENSILKGLKYYRKVQFFNTGRALWRIPKKWPVEIHNQSQGIITFSKLGHYDSSYPKFAQTVAKWTINNMQDKTGYFYYRKTPIFMNKIPYMRWSQAWMMLALTELLINEK